MKIACKYDLLTKAVDSVCLLEGLLTFSLNILDDFKAFSRAVLVIEWEKY